MIVYNKKGDRRTNSDRPLRSTYPCKNTVIIMKVDIAKSPWYLVQRDFLYHNAIISRKVSSPATPSTPPQISRMVFSRAFSSSKSLLTVISNTLYAIKHQSANRIRSIILCLRNTRMTRYVSKSCMTKTTATRQTACPTG